MRMSIEVFAVMEKQTLHLPSLLPDVQPHQKTSSMVALLQCKTHLHPGNHRRIPNQMELGDQLKSLPALVL